MVRWTEVSQRAYHDMSLHSVSGIISPSQTRRVVPHLSSLFEDALVSTWNLRTESHTRNCGWDGFGAGLRQTVPGRCSGNFGNGLGGVGLGIAGPAPRRWYKHVVFRANVCLGDVNTPPLFPRNQNSHRLFFAYVGESASTNFTFN